jgi:hypothetical protein
MSHKIRFQGNHRTDGLNENSVLKHLSTGMRILRTVFEASPAE